METLLKMINVFSWIILIVCPLIISLKIWLQVDYDNSLEKKMDAFKGVQKNFMNGILKILIAFVIALVYLIVS